MAPPGRVRRTQPTPPIFEGEGGPRSPSVETRRGGGTDRYVQPSPPPSSPEIPGATVSRWHPRMSIVFFGPGGEEGVVGDTAFLERAALIASLQLLPVRDERAFCERVAHVAATRFGMTLREDDLRRDRWSLLRPHYMRTPRSALPVSRRTAPQILSPQALLAAIRDASLTMPLADADHLLQVASARLGLIGSTSMAKSLAHYRRMPQPPSEFSIVRAIIDRHTTGRVSELWRRLEPLRRELIGLMGGRQIVRKVAMVEGIRGGEAEIRFLIDACRAGYQPSIIGRGIDGFHDLYSVYLLWHERRRQRLQVLYVSDAIDFHPSPSREAKRTRLLALVGKRVPFEKIDRVVFSDTGWEGRRTVERVVAEGNPKAATTGNLQHTNDVVQGLVDQIAEVVRMAHLHPQVKGIRDRLTRLQGDLHIAGPSGRGRYLQAAQELLARAEALRPSSAASETPAASGGSSLSPRGMTGRGPISRSLDRGVWMSAMPGSSILAIPVIATPSTFMASSLMMIPLR